MTKKQWTHLGDVTLLVGINNGLREGSAVRRVLLDDRIVGVGKHSICEVVEHRGASGPIGSGETKCASFKANAETHVHVQEILALFSVTQKHNKVRP